MIRLDAIGVALLLVEDHAGDAERALAKKHGSATVGRDLVQVAEGAVRPAGSELHLRHREARVGIPIGSGRDAEERLARLVLAAEQVVALADEVPELRRIRLRRQCVAIRLLDVDERAVFAEIEEDARELANRERREATAWKFGEDGAKLIFRLLVEVELGEALAEHVERRLAETVANRRAPSCRRAA